MVADVRELGHDHAAALLRRGGEVEALLAALRPVLPHDLAASASSSITSALEAVVLADAHVARCARARHRRRERRRVPASPGRRSTRAMRPRVSCTPSAASWIGKSRPQTIATGRAIAPAARCVTPSRIGLRPRRRAMTVRLDLRPARHRGADRARRHGRREHAAGSQPRSRTPAGSASSAPPAVSPTSCASGSPRRAGSPTSRSASTRSCPHRCGAQKADAEQGTLADGAAAGAAGLRARVHGEGRARASPTRPRRSRAAARAAQTFSKDFFEAQMEVVIEERVPVYAAGLGDPGPWIPRLHKNGTIVMAVVGAVRHARKVAASGVDIIVAQGHDAGGHNSPVGTMALMPQVVDAVGADPGARRGRHHRRPRARGGDDARRGRRVDRLGVPRHRPRPASPTTRSRRSSTATRRTRSSRAASPGSPRA